MADPLLSPSSSSLSTNQNLKAETVTTITDLNVDSLAHCASYLNLQDVSNMAMTCKYFTKVAYSDAIWKRFFREHWPQQMFSSSSHTGGVRNTYLARRTALQQFKFVDPLVADIYTNGKPFNHIILDKNNIIFSHGSLIQMVKLDSWLSGKDSLLTLTDHNARITSMRLFSLDEILFRGQREDNVLVTSSCDHSIRLWRKGSCQRCFRGHNGPVLTLSDKLLGDGSSKVLASGGEDGTVRLWSFGSSGKRGQKSLKATLFGHEKPVNFMAVAGHKTCLLVTISRDSKVRVWDTTTSSTVRSSCCVGMTGFPGAPVNMRCHESLVYVAAGSSVIAIDLRTMQKVFTSAIYQPKLHSFGIVPSKFLFCTGGDGRAMLWDIRRNQTTMKPEPVAELDGHRGSVTLLHMDPYKIVTGGPDDLYVNVWETETGVSTNTLSCCLTEEESSYSGCAALAVDGCKIVTANCGEEQGIVRFRDFSNAMYPAVKYEDEVHPSKFWDPQSQGDTNGLGD
ncbi:F-box/WD repeat-containing protein [Quillaja saponaria]|uniref:F-box/WD repeat-containing protein n=1 Tax=Quillaja saponaria TaxID=32244 RepID=A0AAD7VBN8_QUISA|nr:F-box/WD repeat-containing protein [Quillaja saponaria]